jgi:membrane-bound lytic murein transglycosylase A
MALLNANPSYVFFREMPNSKDGPIGALGVPLTAERSIAVDPRSVPLGAPVFLGDDPAEFESQAMNRLVMAQDTGGAIKGAVRADFFWGFGKEAGEQAGRMKQWAPVGSIAARSCPKIGSYAPCWSEPFVHLHQMVRFC